MSVYVGVDPANAAQVAHAANVNASEVLRQANTAAATLEDAEHGFVVCNGITYPDLPTAVRAIEVAHYRRLYASAIAQGISISSYQDALATLGAGPYG